MRVPLAATTVVVSTTLLFPGTLGATSVDQFFNHMSEEAQSAYVLAMAKVAEKVLADAGKADLARQVHTLFANPAQPCPTMSGADESCAVEEFKVAADKFVQQEMVRETSGDPSKDSPFLAEEMFVQEMKDHHVELPPAFMAIAKSGKMRATAAGAAQPKK